MCMLYSVWSLCRIMMSKCLAILSIAFVYYWCGCSANAYTILQWCLCRIVMSKCLRNTQYSLFYNPGINTYAMPSRSLSTTVNFSNVKCSPRMLSKVFIHYWCSCSTDAYAIPSGLCVKLWCRNAYAILSTISVYYWCSCRPTVTQYLVQSMCCTVYKICLTPLCAVELWGQMLMQYSVWCLPVVLSLVRKISSYLRTIFVYKSGVNAYAILITVFCTPPGINYSWSANVYTPMYWLAKVCC